MLAFLTPRSARGKEYSYHFETLFKVVFMKRESPPKFTDSFKKRRQSGC